MKNKTSYSKLLPVLFAFFIMGFVDVVGISTNYVKQDFRLDDALANLLPMMVFLWFLVLSTPTGLMMNRLGRKRTVLISMVFTIVAMFIPLVAYSFTMVLVAFAFLGIGNTILQVSLNPLLTNVIRGDRLASSLTFGQFIKAIASFSGPIIAGIAAGTLGNWKYLFPIFAFVTLVSSLWLLLTPIPKEETNISNSSFSECFGLLKDRVILVLFIGILFVVGIDVGLNTTIPKFLMQRCLIPLDKAGLGTSLYFAARTLGTFLGAILLIKLSSRKFYIVSMILGIAAMIIMLFLHNLWWISAMIFILGLTVASIFSIIFTMALQRKPDRANEISGLMIMGVSGGAIFPFLMGLASDSTGEQASGFVILLFAMVYLLISAIRIKTVEPETTT